MVRNRWAGLAGDGPAGGWDTDTLRLGLVNQVSIEQQQAAVRFVVGWAKERCWSASEVEALLDSLGLADVSAA